MTVVAMALSLKKCYVALTYHPCKDVGEKEEQCVNISDYHGVRLATKTMAAWIVSTPIIVAASSIPLGPHHGCLYNLKTKPMHVVREEERYEEQIK
jgi:hypothetical protein